MAENMLEILNLRRIFVEAFEEALIFRFRGTRLLEDVLGWMKEEVSGFSPAVQEALKKY